MQIFVSGSLAYDRIMDFPGKFEDHILPDKIHVLNVSFMVNGLTENFGGTAGNIAYSLSLLGQRPLILATAGNDFDHYEKWLLQCRLPTKGIRRVDDVLTAGAYITTDQSNNQITAFNPGAMQYPSNYEFEPSEAENSLAIVGPGNLDDMQQYCKRYKTLGIDYIFDPGQAIPALTGNALTDMITGCYYLISNDYELEMIKRATEMGIDDILERCQAVITTQGEKGSVIKTRRDEISVDSVPVDHVIDPTGAGDAYRSGLIKGIIEKKPLVEAACMGSVCASFAVEKQGTQVHTFTLEEFDNRYRRYFR
ncbi:MAG: carbohydrate kinase family protein [Deltaproteobacteria bacterium]|nr:MAG: carbohydrate kinase family protein [Deltaproteobacteria bacterium]RUA02575.1 MAG: carbohydrate kinase family protein [Deltaproteobacteria bacterium]